MEQNFPIPEELFLNILSLLPARDILTCSVTCKRVLELIKASSHLSLIVELALQGLRLRNNPPRIQENVHLPTSPVDLLQSRKQAALHWSTLTPTHESSIPLSQFEYEITEALFGHALTSVARGFRGVEFNKLWVKNGQKTCDVWRRYEDVGVTMSDFCFDHAEDLMVLVEEPGLRGQIDKAAKRAFLRTLSSNNPHPRANKAILECNKTEEWNQCDIKICGNILSILFHNPRVFEKDSGRLVIWNWNTGEELLNHIGVGGYAYLTPTLIMMLTITEYSNESAHPLDRIEPPEIELTLHDLRSGQQVTFELPVDYEEMGVNVFSDRPVPDSPNLPADLYVSPYVHDETAERIVVLQFLSQGLMAFISVRKLIRLHNDSLKKMQVDGDENEQSHYSWEEWGPESSLWMLQRTIDGGYTSVCGAKFCGLSFHRDHFTTNESNVVITGETKLQPNPPYMRTIIVMDFNPRPILRDNLLNGNGEEPTSKGLSWKSVFRSISRVSEKEDTNKKKKQDNSGMRVKWRARPPGSVSAIISGLPFRVYQKHVEQEYQDMIMGIDHLVGITGTGEPPSTYEVFQFSHRDSSNGQQQIT
ncbi:hypothetical protein CPB86DRAFT_790432 [Serendipita vermifera]|nr:hypothetical protein CPB86DRAFT_790432 [Serendipita vermifera]